MTRGAPGRLTRTICLALIAGTASADPPPDSTPTATTAPAPGQPAKTEAPPAGAPQPQPATPPQAAAPGPNAAQPQTDQTQTAPPKPETGQQTPQPAPEAKPEAAPAPPSTLEPVKTDEAVAVLGKKVRGPDGKDVMGPVVDVLVDGDGHPRAAIIDFGGFLGVGSRKIAVDWQSLKFRPGDHDAPLVLSMDRAQIQAAPEYKESAPAAEVVEPPSAASPDAGHQAN